MRIASIARLIVLLAAVSEATAQQAALTRDQEEFKRFIRVFNDSLAHHDRQLLSTVITNDTEVWTGSGKQARGSALLSPLLAEPQFWSETTVPQLISEGVHLLSPALAVLNAELVQYGTLGRRSKPAILIFRKNHSDWRLTFFGLFPQISTADWRQMPRHRP